MKKLLSLILSVFVLSLYGYGQYDMVTNNGQTISACSGSLSLGSYTVGQTYTLTICSNDPVNKHITFSVTGGYTFPAGTEVCFYDGASTSAPLILCWDSGTTSGQLAVQTGGGNESGCLTVRFTGGAAGASLGTNNISCNFVCQPREVVIVSSDPPLVGGTYIDVCWDEANNQTFPITFNAQGTYPATGYECTDATNTFTWNFNDGSPLVTGIGMSTVTHTFPERRGYTVTVNIEDSEGCVNTNAEQKRVRVSLPPIWNNSTTVLTTTPPTTPPAICMGSPVNACAYWSNPQWTSVIALASGDTVCVPDTPPLCYESTLIETSFEPGQILTSINDIISIDMNLAHDYLGDLTFYIICPNNQTVMIGNQGGGSANLGVPGPDRNSCEGQQGWMYHITPTATQTMQQAGSGIWSGSLPSGNYASYQSLTGLVGCPLNGQWKLKICDNWNLDAGTIFGWSIQFQESLYPEVWDYSQTYTPTIWDGLYGSVVNDPNNQNCMTGTYITSATPDVNSLQPFTITITDNFGCTHDTSLYVTVRHQLDEECCQIPNVNAGADAAVCALSYDLSASPLAYPSNTGNWELISGPGTATFTNVTSPTTTVNVSVYGTYVFRFHERYNDNPGCASSDDVTITFNPTYNPTLSPVANMCVNAPPFMLEMVDFGTLSVNINPELLNVTTGQFNPSKPGNYTITNTVQDPCSGGSLTHSISFTVYDAITVQNFTEYCGPTSATTYFYVEFDVVGSQGNPFSGYYVNGTLQSNPHYIATIESPGSYGYTVTDAYNCSSYPINGFRDCGCPFYAGTMTSLQTVILCETECSGGEVSHNNDQETDGGAGVFEFMIHNGNNQPIAYSNTPNFCRTSATPPLSFNTLYYISPICGLPGDGGHAVLTGCHSIGQGTPVMWLQNPVAHVGPSKDTCGLIIQLQGNAPTDGMYGYWSSTCDFITINGTSHTDPNAVVMVSDYEDCTFTWNIVNGECVANADVLMRFLATPAPYAGPDLVVCGNSAEMAGVASMGGNLTWSGSGTIFNPQTSADATSNISVFGTYQYTLIEDNGSCTGSDKVLVTYIKEPSPITTPNVDTACGVTYNLKVTTVPNAVGQWTSYAWNEATSEWELAYPYMTPNSQSTDVQVQIGNFSGITRRFRFVWTETNTTGGIVCQGTASKEVVFAKIPQASVVQDQLEVCGSCVDLHANVTSETYNYDYYWIPKIDGNWTNPEGRFSPDASFCVEGLAVFGDSASVNAEFYWIVRNGTSCVSTAAVNVTFHQQPQANAGLDTIICGLEANLHAYWSFPPNPSYSPSGVWSTVPKPGATATIQDKYNPISPVTVSEAGVWNFVFRENNENLGSCYSTDTVQIEFVETPIPFAGEDKHVCGKCVTLEATSGGFSGTWLPNGASFVDYEDPHTNACVAAYDTVVFIWQESNPSITDPAFACVATDEVNIIFWRVPTANIITAVADSAVCGLTFYELRAELPGTGITGYWYCHNSGLEYGDKFSNNTWVKVPHYGYYDFYWIEQTGPNLSTGFCIDTAGPLRVHFIETPIANGGGDTLFCGLTGNLNAIPSVGTSTGTWSKPTTANITFADKNDPNTQITAAFNNTAEQPYYELIWTEDNTNDCTDRDTIKVTFARVPNSDITIIPPKCFGEPATIAAVEDSLAKYTWNFYTGILDSSVNNIQHGARYLNFVRWTGKDTIHRISLVAESSLGCQSPVTVDTVYEPSIPDFDHIIVNDTCLLGKGGLIFEDTLGSNVFFWLDPDYGPNPGDAVTAVYNLPEGDYRVATSYMSPNIQHYEYYSITFGTTNCLDTLTYTVDPIGVIQAIIDVDPQMIYEELVAPNAKAIFINRSDYDDIRRRCEWHFDDGTAPQKTCDSIVEHIYTKSGCYEPFLIVMNRDLPECRDTARLDHCILVEEKSEIEVPNIFSPNGDGVNDFFQVKAQTLKEFKGVITNRWGRKVYEWTDWETYEAGWDGNINGGSKAAPGVYFYSITATGFDGNVYEMEGAFHLMRE